MSNETSCLGMFDTRGIQEYIFRSDRIKSIMGASLILDRLFDEGTDAAFSVVAQKREYPREKFVNAWYKSDGSSDARMPVRAFRFGEDNSILAEVLNIGGGNMQVLFRTIAIARAFADELTRYVLEHTYSLSVASAFVPITGDYLADYACLRQVLARVKMENASMRPEANAPFVLLENGTGLPITHRVAASGERISTETWLKRTAPASDERARNANRTDDFADSIARKSLVALVHIDGNSIGSQINARIQQTVKDYASAVSTLREISTRLYNAFNVSAFHAMQNISKDVGFRPLIGAGDDITFLCPAADAMAMTLAFLEALSAHRLYAGSESPLTACAGICYVHSHFPLRRAYDITEALCGSAKQRANSTESCVDFHIIRAGLTGSLSAIRKAEYKNKNLLRRPFTLKETKALLTEIEKLRTIPSSWRKAMRNAYHANDNAEVEDVFRRAASRKYDMGAAWLDDGKAAIYDALELLDMTVSDAGEQEGYAE